MLKVLVIVGGYLVLVALVLWYEAGRQTEQTQQGELPYIYENGGGK